MSLSSAETMWIMKDQYSEHGPRVVDNDYRKKVALLNAADFHSAFDAENAFGRFDADGDGSISERELMEHLSKFDPNMTPEACHALFLSVDKNKNGELDLREFTDVLMAHYRDVYGCDI